MLESKKENLNSNRSALVLKKNHFSLFIKIAVGIASFGFIYFKLKPQLSPDSIELLKNSFTAHNHFLYLCFTFLLLFANWGIEILKWQVITRSIESVNYYTATKSVLTGICLGNLTPGRIGEFAGRILFFKTENRSKIAVTHFVCGLTQLFTTVSLGIIALLIRVNSSGQENNFNLILICCLTFFGILILLIAKINSIYPWLSQLKWLKRFNLGQVEYSQKTLMLLMLLSVLRYSVFSFQYFLLLTINGVEGNTLQLFAAIAVSFMLMSSIPMISFIEAAIRAAIAILLFESFHANNLQIVSASTLLWLINIMLPSLIGYFIFVKRKPDMIISSKFKVQNSKSDSGYD